MLAAVDVARARGLPVTSRGAGPRSRGTPVEAGLVLDFLRHLRTVAAGTPMPGWPWWSPGPPLMTSRGGPAPAPVRARPLHARSGGDRGRSGNNAWGARAIGYGRTSNNVVELDVVTGRGERMVAGRGQEPPGSVAERYRAGLAAIAPRLGSDAELARDAADGCRVSASSARASSTRRTARSFTSGGYRLEVFLLASMAPTFPRCGASRKSRTIHGRHRRRLRKGTHQTEADIAGLEGC